MYPHFPLEFMFLFAPRLATWHSDFLIPKENMREFATLFERLADGETFVTEPGINRRRKFARRQHRYWELIACTTAGASRSQYENGAGWWKTYAHHINCPSQRAFKKRKRYYWDHGSGVYFWEKQCGGKVEIIESSAIKQWHFTKIGNKDFVRSAPIEQNASREMSVDLRRNFDLLKICRDLGLEDFLPSQ